MSTLDPKVDVLITDQGTIVVFAIVSAQAAEWVDQHVQTEDWQWMGKSLAVDHRYAPSLIEGLQEAGLTLSGRGYA